MTEPTDKLSDLDVVDLVSRVPWYIRLLMAVTGRRLNIWFYAPVLTRAYERGVINRRQLHLLHKQFDPSQDGVAGRA